MGEWISSVVTTSIAVPLAMLTPGPLGEALVSYAIRLSLVGYFASIYCGLRGRRAADRSEALAWQRRSRAWSTAGCLAFGVHVAGAFHFYHGWSHASAVDRTREVSGVGEGIFASYLFGVGWLWQVVWWWWVPLVPGERPSRWQTIWQVFALFIVFNGAIVFEDGWVRWLSLPTFAGLAYAYLGGFPPSRPN